MKTKTKMRAKAKAKAVNGGEWTDDRDERTTTAWEGQVHRADNACHYNGPCARRHDDGVTGTTHATSASTTALTPGVTPAATEDAKADAIPGVTALATWGATARATRGAKARATRGATRAAPADVTATATAVGARAATVAGRLDRQARTPGGNGGLVVRRGLPRRPWGAVVSGVMAWRTH